MNKGASYNRLTAIKFVKKDKWNKPRWLFKCTCGKIKEIDANRVRRGIIKSCGCLAKETVKDRMTTHGMGQSKEYSVWSKMKDRCLRITNNPSFANYGGRGITLCERWMKFENFYADMGKIPKGKTLDRINNNGNYCKDNCRWATSREQSNNRRNNIIISVNNKKMTLKQCTSLSGSNYKLAHERLKRGWGIKEAIFKPRRDSLCKGKIATVAWRMKKAGVKSLKLI